MRARSADGTEPTRPPSTATKFVTVLCVVALIALVATCGYVVAYLTGVLGVADGVTLINLRPR